MKACEDTGGDVGAETEEGLKGRGEKAAIGEVTGEEENHDGGRGVQEQGEYRRAELSEYVF